MDPVVIKDRFRKSFSPNKTSGYQIKTLSIERKSGPLHLAFLGRLAYACGV